MDKRKAAFRWGIRQAIYWLLLMLVLMLSYGGFDWLNGWLLLAVVALCQIINAIALIPDHVDLLIERTQIAENTKKQDIILAVAMAYSTIFIGLFCGLDARFVWSPNMPFWSALLLSSLLFAGAFLVLWAMLANAYFSGVVRIQFDRGHKVVSEGPYRFVRHPGYVGAILTNFALPVVLGSMWGLLLALVFIGLAVLRTKQEDDYLQAHLAGYREYAVSIKYRLFPGVW